MPRQILPEVSEGNETKTFFSFVRSVPVNIGFSIITELGSA
jgi:hypothetical protein